MRKLTPQWRRLFYALLMGWTLSLAPSGIAAEPTARAPQAQAGSNSTFDPDTASRAYLSRLSPQQKARSDAYFEGGYWLQLWQFLYNAIVAIVLLHSRLSARMRDLAARLSRFKPVQTGLYAIQYILLFTLLTFPSTWYGDFLREHQYGMANQAFSGWLGDWAKSLAVSLVLGTLLIMALFGVVRRLPRLWPILGAIVTLLFLILGIVIAPVYIAPLFNKYKPLADPKVVDPILRMARANGITADKVYEMDASKQTKRISANVSGFLGTMRITLNDNLLNRAGPTEIEAVMGHEIGHYALNHVFKSVLFFGVIIVVGFALLRAAITGLLSRWGLRWQITGTGDPAIVPLVTLIFSTYLFLLTPFTNSFIRMQEMEADRFGLNAARQPDGFAEAALQLSEYRKMEPTPFEEWIFYDHPSGATRIRTAMRWKAENPSTDGSGPIR